jgi:hypothetical protein
MANESQTTADIFPRLRSEKFWADRLDVCATTLARARRRGELSYCRVGDRVLYSDAHIAEWLKRVERPARKAGRQ